MNEMIKPSSSTLLPLGAGPMNWIRGEIDRLFDDFTQPGRSIFSSVSPGVGPVPAMDLVDKGKEYCLTAELPGLTDKDIDIELSDGILTIAGEKSEKSETKDCGCLMTERRYGSFRRQLSLPADADPESIEASAGSCVVGDAVFGQAAEKRALEKVARQQTLPFHGFWLDLAEEDRIGRIRDRGPDASDATVAVARRQSEDLRLVPDGWVILPAGTDIASLAAVIQETVSRI
jgi:HSP20 family molecular chaperone IbpA